MSKEKKYEINYTGNGKSYIIYDNNIINISLLDDFVINVISEPIKTYVTIDEDKLKATLEKYKTDKKATLEKYKTDKKEPEVLTRMRLSCCWGDNLNDKELSEVVDYIDFLQQEVEELKEEIERQDNLNTQLVKQCQTFDDNWNELKKWLDKLNEMVR